MARRIRVRDRAKWLKWRSSTPAGKVYAARSSARQRVAVRRDVLAAYGGACEHCGINDPDVLTIDHVGGRSLKNHARDFTGGALWRRVRSEGCPPDYRLLCFNCNVKDYRVRARSLDTERLAVIRSPP